MTISNRGDVRSPGRRLPVRIGVALAFAIALAMLAGPANADLGAVHFAGGAFNQDGTSATQAASHPYSATTTIDFPDVAIGFFQTDASPKDIEVDLPAGFVGNPGVVPTECTADQLYGELSSSGATCPPSSQVGTAEVRVAVGVGASGVLNSASPLYKMVTPPDRPAVFAFTLGGTLPTFLVPTVRTGGDYGLTVISPRTPQGLMLTGASVTLWGAPADPSHDSQRRGANCPSGCPAGFAPRRS